MVIGEMYGALLFIKMIDGKNALLSCSCGCDVIRNKIAVQDGKIVNCGCLDREQSNWRGVISKRHGMSNTNEYAIWGGLKQRVTNPNHPRYADYGGRGITLCKEWYNDFMAFYADVGPRPSNKHSIDRIDNSKGYIPGNVRWGTDDVQANNKRNNTRYIYQGNSYTISELSEISDIIYTTLQQRLLGGWDVVVAMETPAKAIPKYLYRGVMMNLVEISKASGVQFDSIRHRITRKGMTVEAAVALGNPSIKLHTHDGISLTIKEWAEKLGMKVDTLRNKLGRQGYSISEVVEMIEHVSKN